MARPPRYLRGMDASPGMDRTARASFDVTAWEPAGSDAPTEGPGLSRVAIRKTFRGDLDGESAGEGLFCGLEDPAAGAGYAVQERFRGRLGGHAGTFVLQHTGLTGPGAPPKAAGHVVPGSGTGALAGLRGEIEFHEGHAVTLRYTLGAPEAGAVGTPSSDG